ncbi:unnamed protein product [Spirodela intermedia]|uniref:Uncharacterized protein n=1 Tax=Spirodela intermedia TaxID=51605 RepID=A0A7I8J165_SPIIN|nr:unnamed protein product [Spirodela intermedia]CAA6663553.1 unnamed protein product [Spirodela intermedia]
MGINTYWARAAAVGFEKGIDRDLEPVLP